MPIMDGWAASKEINRMIENSELPMIPIIALTAFTSKQDMENCRASGMRNVLAKPLKISEFKEIIIQLE